MKKIFVNGTFDILHVGHIGLLNYAKSLGDILVVGIDSDSRVKQLKGESRPINNENERLLLLINLKSVNEVYIFKNDQELIDLICGCDIMVKGSDYESKPIIGSDLIPVIFYEYRNEWSTTKKIQHIINR
jgi:D-beta-D-heptose 7-phosphate kinase/D-beta-D-heptose 1-phosphate adenosyltransferase